MKSVSYYIIILALVALGCTKHYNWDFNIEKDWEQSEGLVLSESVIYDPGTKYYYVSSSPEFAKTGRGYISKVSRKGEMVNVKWVEGLNRPTGMAIQGNTLYVGDMDALVTIDIAEAKVIDRYEAPVNEFPGINDVSINSQNEVYVTASAIHGIFKLEEAGLKLWLKDSVNLKWANGIIAEDDRLVVAGEYLSEINLKTNEINDIIESGNIYDLDGLEPDGKGGYFVTSAGPGVNTMWHISDENQVHILVKGQNFHSDFDYIPELKRIVSATGNHEDKAYGIIAYKVKYERFTRD